MRLASGTRPAGLLSNASRPRASVSEAPEAPWGDRLPVGCALPPVWSEASSSPVGSATASGALAAEGSPDAASATRAWDDGSPA